MLRTSRLIVSDEKAVYHVMPRTALDGFPLKDIENEESSNISNEDLGINPEMEIKLSEEKYKICLQMLTREKYDHIWFTLKEIKKSDDDDFSLEKIAILYIYFKKLPKIEVYFYQNPENIS